MNRRSDHPPHHEGLVEQAGNDNNHRDDRRSSSSRSEGKKKKKRKVSSHRNHRQHERSRDRSFSEGAVCDNDVSGYAHLAAARVAAASGLRPSENGTATLVEHFRQVLQGEGAQHPEIDIQKAQNALEATAGNIQMAAQLYWDDYFASHAAASSRFNAPDLQMQQHQEPQKEHNNYNHPRNKRSRNDQKISAGRSCHPRNQESSDSDNEDVFRKGPSDRHPHRKLRRSLDQDFGRAADRGFQGMGERHENPERHEDLVAQNELPPFNQNRQHDGGNEPRERARPPQQLLVDALAGERDRLNHDVGGESVSVSDDENGNVGTWRILGSTAGELDNDSNDSALRHDRRQADVRRGARIREAAAAVASKVLQRGMAEEVQCRHRRNKEDVEQAEDINDISDNEWVEEGLSTKSPTELLWGDVDLKSPNNKTSDSDASEGIIEGNVVADEENDEKDKNSNAGGIPYTWLNASFNLSACGSGLEVKAPLVEDIEAFTWRQQNQGLNVRAPGVPPPFHCRAITAVLSIVTALLYTGASIQGKQVNCTSARKPFHELTSEDRKREFETRLIDAIAALLHVAATKSIDRKRKAIRRFSRNIASMGAATTDTAHDCKLQNMRRRLKLVPTCFLEEDGRDLSPRTPGGPAYQRVQIATSWTNIEDIRLYVASNIRCFTSKGGVALLLETISRIHGRRVIERMMKISQQEAKDASRVCSSSLIRCTCEERQLKKYKDKPLPASVRNDPTKLLDTTPSGHECISVELISLLLTGTVHRTWRNWSTEGLGFGFLGKRADIMGWQLARPERPVWILQGDQCYSVLYLESVENSERETVARLNVPGSAMRFKHWNAWYHQRQLTAMRLIAAQTAWKAPKQGIVFSNFPSGDEEGILSSVSMQKLILKRRRSNQASLAAAIEHKEIEQEEKENQVTAAEIDRVEFHPDDQRFFPSNYKFWRFNMHDNDKIVSTDDGERIVKAMCGSRRILRWLPYHCLSKRQKMVIEMKLGPSIRKILWTRWPASTLDKCTSDDQGHPIV